ncbi:hypothetical protein MRB53_000032 [Persea americana]|uniref:Uncharacterized protein n=1 Tax=Persea americana TaxID=3435 RepID=A0ACC2MNS7_PERAE|nr:hypothetical protein MRB53_000032 [Persea americana]
MAMTRFVIVVVLVLFAILMVESKVLAKETNGAGGEYHLDKNAHRNARGGVEEHSTRSRASSSVISAATSACVCLLATMGTKESAPATITGRQRKEDPSALRHLYSLITTMSSLSISVAAI